MASYGSYWFSDVYKYSNLKRFFLNNSLFYIFKKIWNNDKLTNKNYYTKNLTIKILYFYDLHPKIY